MLGVRSKAQDHEEGATLIGNLPVTDARQRADAAVDVIQLKNLVEYEARELDSREAETVAKKVGRFLAWARTNVRK